MKKELTGNNIIMREKPFNWKVGDKVGLILEFVSKYSNRLGFLLNGQWVTPS